MALAAEAIAPTIWARLKGVASLSGQSYLARQESWIFLPKAL